MTTWQDLTPQEQAELMTTALIGNYQHRVNEVASDHATNHYPYYHLCALGLLQEVERGEGYVTYTITPAAAALLLAAPDEPGGNDFFPLANDMAEMKKNLRSGQDFRVEE